jgi:Family of unknown function (DUF5317)
MLFLVAPFIIGLAISCLAGGDLGRLQHTRSRGTLLAATALLMQVLLFSPLLETREWAIRYGPYAYLLSMVAVFVVIAANIPLQIRRIQRVALVGAALGVLLNCIVVGANGAYMPRMAADSHPAVPSPADAGRLVNVAPMGEDTRLAVLGDILPEPGWWPLSNVLSVGDLLLATGLAFWGLSLTRPSGPSRPTSFPAYSSGS